MRMGFDRIAIIGFGEAGPAFAQGFLANGAGEVRAYDLLIDDPKTRDAQRARTEAMGVIAAASNADAVRGADLVVSTVTADQAVAAARASAAAIDAGAIYLDLNSTSPRAKGEAAAAIAYRGAHYLDAVAMDTVPRHGYRVPLLLAGPKAQALTPAFAALGLNLEVVGDRIGQACAIKLIRSVLIKGLEAIFAEAMLAAGEAGVVDRVLASLDVTLPGLNWPEVAGYSVSRLAIHGKRRAAEMEAAAETLAGLGITPIMAKAIAMRERWADEAGLSQVFDAAREHPSVADFLAAVARAEGKA